MDNGAGSYRRFLDGDNEGFVEIVRDYKDGLIRVYDREHRGRDSRLLWALGNYSRFVRPGAVRYNITSDQEEDPYGLMASAFRNKDNSWVVVVINYSQQEKPFSFSVDKKKNKWQPYRTSDAEGETLKPLTPCKGRISLPPRSITTFVSL